jgi:uncharacterized protein
VKILRAVAVALLLLISVAGWAQAPIPPPPERWVTDTVGLLTPGVRDRVDRRLEAYEGHTGHQIVVWIGDDIGEADLAGWAVRTFEAWGVGRAEHDDGLVVFLLAEQRAIDIEVGYGLEGVVPDAVAHRVRTEVMGPRLAAGDPDGAVVAGVEALLTAIEGRPVPQDLAPPAQQTRPPSTIEIVVGVIGAVLFVILLITNPRLALWLMWSVMMRGGGGGGGGGGGFSGGGGRSGGGGARGSW